MSESMSSAWIRDYFIDVAEKYGAQLFNAPASSGRPKKVQLTDFLTYQENSYVWAWISDKDRRVSVRISQDAVDLYKSKLKRSIVDCRFSVVSISDYRPVFSPRPLGPNATGNTPVSHLSLEIGHVKSVGVGGHLFGNPRDLESDENIKEWVLGLRQDGGGGNVLKLRKQQASMQTRQTPPPPPPPPPFSLYAPVPERPPIKRVQDTVKPKPLRPQDFKHTYNKRWKIYEANPWKYAMKPVTEERPDSCPTSPCRTPTKRQGTPTEWSPSNKGTPVASNKDTVFALVDGSPQCDQPNVLPTPPHPPSHMEKHATANTVISPDTHFLQPPTPAQRIRSSPPPRSTPHPRSSPEVIARSSPHSSQHLPASSPPLPSSSVPLPSSSLPTPAPMGIRKNIQRKVPHPGLPVTQPASTKNGPIQILVPNSDTSGTGSSQVYSQSQLHSQSQHFQLPSSLANSFKPPNASTPKEEKPSSSTGHVSKISAESLPSYVDVDVEEQEIAPLRQKSSIHKLETDEGKRGEPDSTRPPTPSTPRTEVLEVGTSDTEEETEQLQLTRTATRTQDSTQTRKQEEGKRDFGTDLGDDQVRIEVLSAGQSTPRRPSPQPATSVIPHPSPNNQSTDRLPIHHLPQSPERRPVSRSSMYSLFSDSLEYERTTSSHAPVDRMEVKVQEKIATAHIPTHDPEAWKEPSFLARRKGKGKALAPEERDAPSVEKMAKKHGRTVESGSPVRKRAKVAASDRRRVASGQATTGNVRHQTNGAPAAESIHPGNDPSTSPMGTAQRTTPSTLFQSPKPRLANFVVDFERVNLGKGVPVPIADIKKDAEDGFLRTGRIRTLGQEVEKDGNAYIMK